MAVKDARLRCDPSMTTLHRMRTNIYTKNLQFFHHLALTFVIKGIYNRVTKQIIVIKRKE